MSESEPKPIETKKSKTLRCEFSDCKKKLGLLGFDCRCGHQYCAQHRAAELHSCSYDYRQDAKKELLKYMSSPVMAAKVAVI
jgi:hypothetical protein